MRRILLFAIVPSLAATAQPILQYDNVDLIGKTFAVHLVTDPGSSDPNADGANVTWDFSSATLSLNVGSTSFMEPGSTPYGASYPTSNLAQSVVLPTGTTYTYFDLTSAQLDMLADGVGGSDPSIYSDPKTPLIFPFALTNYFIDYYNDNGTDYSVSRAYMGYGTVILPTGTYTNVVKVASTSGAIDFFRSNPVEHLVNIDPDGLVLVFGDAVTGVPEQPTVQLAAYPNPATDVLTVTGTLLPGTYDMLDAQGRALLQGRYGTGNLTLGIGELAPGSYVLLLRDAKGQHSVRVAKR